MPEPVRLELTLTGVPVLENNVGKAEQGVIYVGIGTPHLVMALSSARSLKAHHPSLPVALVSDVDELQQLASARDMPVDVVIPSECDKDRNRRAKISVGQFSPFAKSLYLDADTHIAGRLDPLFALLDYCDIAFRVNPFGQSKAKGAHRIDESLQSDIAPHWNSGVFPFRDNERTETFFTSWLEAFDRRGLRYDQFALVDAILHGTAVVLPLDYRWNCPTNIYLGHRRTADIRVVHYASSPTRKQLVRLDREAKIVAEHLGSSRSSIMEEMMDDRFKARIQSNIAHHLAELVGWARSRRRTSRSR